MHLDSFNQLASLLLAPIPEEAQIFNHLISAELTLLIFHLQPLLQNLLCFQVVRRTEKFVALSFSNLLGDHL
ncbi:MAG: hypothetical protein C4287_21985 [Leptolyngbya sp. ERB_1_2]